MARRYGYCHFSTLWDLEYGTGEDVGVAVKSWDFEDDGQTVVFELYDNIYDYDGNNYTMDDLVWYVDYYTGPVGKKLSNILGVEKIDTYKGKINMKLKYYPGYLAASVSFNVFTRAAYEAAGDEGFRTYAVGTGRYTKRGASTSLAATICMF